MSLQKLYSDIALVQGINAVRKTAKFKKQALTPLPGDPAAMGGGMPMDPAAMGGMPMDPAAMGGMPPMDPAMMGAGGMPPVDPAMMAQMAGMPPMPPADPAAGAPIPGATPPAEEPAAKTDEGMKKEMAGLRSEVASMNQTLNKLTGFLVGAKLISKDPSAPDDAAAVPAAVAQA